MSTYKISKLSVIKIDVADYNSYIYKGLLDTTTDVCIKFPLLGEEKDFENSSQLISDEYDNYKLLNDNNIHFPKCYGMYGPGLVIEWIEGITLEDVTCLKFMKTFTLEKLCLDILEGINELHIRNLSHNDIKPSNIIYSERRKKWLLIDFGLTTFLDEKEVYERIGTDGYRDPEIETSRKVHNRTDVYGFGKTMLELWYKLICKYPSIKVKYALLFTQLNRCVDNSDERPYVVDLINSIKNKYF